MSRIKVTREFGATGDQVWRELSELASHVEWMKDAVSIVFTTEATSGIGAVLEVETRVGPFRIWDVMEVVGWNEGRSIEVDHIGLVRGRGILSASPTADGTLVTWIEELEFPWWLGGPVGAWVARPVLAAIWRGNLERLEARLSSP